MCKEEGCTSIAKNQQSELCQRHGAFGNCKVEGCDKYAAYTGICYTHIKTHRVVSKESKTVVRITQPRNTGGGAAAAATSGGGGGGSGSGSGRGRNGSGGGGGSAGPQGGGRRRRYKEEPTWASSSPPGTDTEDDDDSDGEDGQEDGDAAMSTFKPRNDGKVPDMVASGDRSAGVMVWATQKPFHAWYVCSKPRPPSHSHTHSPTHPRLYTRMCT